MKILSFFSVFTLLLFLSCKGGSQGNPNKQLICEEYWAQVPFSDFCGLSASNFKFNTIPNDICNADQNDTYPYDDRISIRVYNHFINKGAREEYDDEEENARSTTGFTVLSDLGDDAFAVLKSQFGQLDFATVLVIKGTYTVYLEINGNASNGANNCFDESSVIKFAKALVGPL
ncbi:MAG TPA: hypothetical protein PKE06_12130 [Flavilitoribacter sp.]|nr:hypothetical protein [Flavilitoribacter sp.]HMQ87996.1 hypothetical protein [Flavilitoribacter sp.]